MTPEELEKSERFITTTDGKRYHIYDKGARSLCRTHMVFRPNASNCDPITGNENYVKGQDCKACFKKAGLKVEA